MSIIRVREKNQVTLPGDVMQALGIQAPGHLQYTILQDGILFQALMIPAQSKLAKIQQLAQSVPSVYKDAAAADHFISQQRDAWDQ